MKLKELFNIIASVKKYPPLDILSLAFAESSFNPTARNPATNAVGLYQMTPWAIKRVRAEDMNIFDPIIATKVVCNFLDLIEEMDLYKLDEYKNTKFYQYLSDFERLAILYHYGLMGAKSRFKLNFVNKQDKETLIYISNIRKGKLIALELIQCGLLKI
ncbi:hypothetical protein X275_08225 [Marinitoga sp. 1197]|uniref:transglycosylase SLT domain-containing protein n=1 Tax=Marinitoga sp. 1197 TaxID=1428449 RepID=UPI000640C318|nr:transglycosylase SLT domain-containing protein [Marinitoga sp. 1197]KLO21868.1 hypothetical protein X275_08225 [Marinitoga sp. 1197]